MHAFSHKLNQVTYPRMERQDLTQGQLGSFKFTPTDGIHHSYARSPPVSVHPFTQSHASASASNTITSDKLRTTTAPSNNECSVYVSPTSDTPSTRFDSTFFNSHIQPNLGKSRLLLGPSALRAAVDGAPTSPGKQLSSPRALRHRSHTNDMDNNIPPQENGYSGESMPFSTFPTFVPRAANTAQSDASLLHVSLIRALAAEQEAHQATKGLLELEKNRRIIAESEAQKYQEHNRSLIGSVNMLKSVVQHNVKKEQQANQEAEVSRYYQAVEEASPPQTILHDAVKNLRVPVREEPKPEKLLDAKLLFDFDLVEKHGSPALRRHFSTLASETGEEKPAKIRTTEQLISDDLEETVKEGKSEDRQESSDDRIEKDVDAASVNNETVVLQIKDENVPKAKPENSGKSMAMPFDPLVNWKKTPIFDSHTDKFNRVGLSQSVFAEHPVRYFPDLSDKNIYRTVMIDFLPLSSTCAEILDEVRGGAIESIQLFGPIGHSTHFMTARIVFNYERSSNGVYRRGQSPGIYIKGKRVRVWQVLEATYPRDRQLEAQIFEEGFTRILIVEGAIDASLDKLPKKLARQMRAGSVVGIGKTYDDIPMIEFASVAQAARALEQLMNDRDFGGCRFDFDDDPCNDPYPRG